MQRNGFQFERMKFHFFIRGCLSSGPVLAFVLFGLPVLSAGALSAQENPPETVRIEGRDWSLFSYGVRNYAFFDVYQCALYLDSGQEGEVGSIQNLDRPMGIRIEVLTSEMPGEVPDPWENAIRPEVSDKLYSRFKKQFFKLDKGDVLFFTYLPEQATEFYLNGEKKFSDPGPALFEALLGQWIGADPVSEDLKTSLMKR